MTCEALGEAAFAESGVDPVDQGPRLGRRKAARGVVDRDRVGVGASVRQEADQATVLDVRQDLGQCEQGYAKTVLVAAIPPLMLGTEANPEGRPLEVYEGFRAALAGDRAQCFRDVPVGPFHGFNRAGAEVQEGVIQNWWRQGMMGGAKAHYDCIRAFAETEQTEDLKATTVPTLVPHGEEDQVVPIAASARKAVKLKPDGALKTHPGLSHGMLTENAKVLNADLPAFSPGRPVSEAPSVRCGACDAAGRNCRASGLVLREDQAAVVLSATGRLPRIISNVALGVDAGATSSVGPATSRNDAIRPIAGAWLDGPTPRSLFPLPAGLAVGVGMQSPAVRDRLGNRVFAGRFAREADDRHVAAA